MSACTISAIDRRPALPAALALALALLAAPEAGAAGPAAGPADLQRIVERADKALDKAEGAVRGRDPGHVSLLLKRVDDELAGLQEASRLEALAAAIDAARDAARAGDLQASAGSIQRCRGLYPPLSDYVVLRQAEESSRSALRAAQSGDAQGCLEAIDRFDASVLPRVLLKRIQEGRQGVARARTAMVRSDMKGGAEEVAGIRRALDGLRYAGALSRAVFGLGLGSELLQQGALVAARDQVQRALRDLRVAGELGSGRDGSAALEQARSAAEEVWRRITRPQEGDAARLLDARQAIDAIRRRQR